MCNGLGTREDLCPDCNGSATEFGDLLGPICGYCGGSGVESSTCSMCTGSGELDFPPDMYEEVVDLARRHRQEMQRHLKRLDELRRRLR
jgi:hypothetical protein